jgi:hypothetical protein
MTFENILIYLITNFLCTLVNGRLISLFFERSEKQKLVKVLTLLFYYCVTSVGHLLFNRPEINIITNLCGLMVMTFIYYGNIKKKVLSVFLIYFLNMTCDVIAVFLFLNHDNMDIINPFRGSVTVLIIVLITVLIERPLRKKNLDDYNISPHWKLLFLIPVSGIVIICYDVMENSIYRKGILREGIGLLIINIITFYLYSITEDTYLENLDKEIMIQSYKTYEYQLGLILSTQDQIRSLQHDMKFHIRELLYMVNNRERKEVVDYIVKMGELTDNAQEFVYSGNKEIDSNLNYFLNMAYEKLNTVSVNVNIPENSVYFSFDINIIVSNLLDNAIHGAELSKEKTISFDMRYNKSLLYIVIENSHDRIIKMTGSKIVTSKKNSELHGYGLKNVKRIVNKYNGVFDVKFNNNRFNVKVMLYLSGIVNS